MSVDFRLNNQGTISLLTPFTAPARQWVRENLPDDRTMFGAAVVLEHRYVGDICDGIGDAGMTIGPPL